VQSVIDGNKVILNRCAGRRAITTSTAQQRNARLQEATAHACTSSRTATFVQPQWLHLDLYGSWVLHGVSASGVLCVLCRPGPDAKVEDCEFEPNEVYAIDIVVSSGEQHCCSWQQQQALKTPKRVQDRHAHSSSTVGRSTSQREALQQRPLPNSC
jgi:hypothetical protein